MHQSKQFACFDFGAAGFYLQSNGDHIIRETHNSYFIAAWPSGGVKFSVTRPRLLDGKALSGCIF